MEPEKLIFELERGGKTIVVVLRDVDAETAKKRPNPGKWSLLEVLCHLYDEEREDFRRHLEQMLEGNNQVWHPIDPEGWVAARRYNNRDVTEMLNKFIKEREKSLQWLRELIYVDWGKTFQAPFGEIRAGDILSAWVMHDNLHIRQLIELRYGLVNDLSHPFSTSYAGEW